MIDKEDRFVTTNGLTKNIALVITRSVGVICLSRYLQHLTLTGYKILKQLNYL
jgi:hypothetical protein